MQPSVWIVMGISWLLAAVLLFDAARQPYPRLLKAALMLVLLIPIIGPLFYLWIRSFPAPGRDDLLDHQRYELDILNRWRGRLEAAGFFPARWSVQGGRSHKARVEQSFSDEGREEVADAAARASKRKAKRLRRANLYKRLGKKKK
jgi:hypothetical protein